MKKQTRTIKSAGLAAGLGTAIFSAAIIAPSIFISASAASATTSSGTVRLNAEVATAIAMKIASPNDTNPDCLPESGVTYGTANRYATSNGAEGSKQVDTFDGTIGGADEINNNTSCATLTMSPNTFSSTYSDITVYTNSPNGYALSVRSADGISPNLVNTTDNTQYISAGALTEQDGTGEQAGQKIVPGAQNKWAIKGDTNSNLDTWTAVTTLDQTVRAYDTETSGGSSTRVTYGVSSGNNPVGKYTTTLTYTATMFDGDNTYLPSIIPSTTAGISVDTSKLRIPYTSTRSLIISPSAGHYLASLTCSNGFTCTDENGDPVATGTTVTSPTVVYVTNDSIKTGSGTMDVTAGTSEYTVSASATNATVSTSSLTIPYGSSKTLTVTPNTGYYLSSFSCPEGYSCTKEDGSAIATGDNATAQAAQTIKITNNNTTSGGTVSFTSALRDLTVAITPSANATTSTNSLSVPYGGSKTFTITPNAGYYLTGVTCSTGYTCSTPTYGSAADPNATSRGTQTITVTNNSSTNTGAISFTLANTYRISFSKTNISSPSASYVDVAYGGQTTVTVTPASGYYLSAFSGCPSGWTCSGVSTGTSYTGNQTLTLKNNSSTNIGTITLAGTIATEYMQDFSCSSLSSGITKTLRDSRDNNDYTVAKLKDGKCWMTSNLRLVGSKTLTSSDSNVSSNFTLPASNGSRFCTNSNTTNCDGRPNVSDSGNESYGVYYNWYAATAGTGKYGTVSGNTTASICPKGWRLPTDTEFRALYNNYNSASAMMDASGPAFVLSGYHLGSFANDQGSGGAYWSSTAASGSNAYGLSLDSSSVFPHNGSAKYLGYTVRCVASS